MNGIYSLDMSKYQARAQRLQNEFNGQDDYSVPSYTPVVGDSVQIELY